MLATTLRRQIATVVCTVLMSSICVLSAVGPAQADTSAATVVRPLA